MRTGRAQCLREAGGVGEPVGPGRSWLATCSAAAGRAALVGVVPGLDADFIERFGRPLHDVERVRATDRVLAPLSSVTVDFEHCVANQATCWSNT